MGSDKILDGITVVDTTTFVTGGFCSLMLANQGAEVIKVERPGTGDDNRHSGPPFISDESPYFWTVNYDKRSVELNLKSDAGKEAFYKLIDEADVFIQNYRPGVAAKLDVDEETLRERNPTLIYTAISAYGQSGPWHERPGYDLLIQGMSGIMSVTGEEDGRPVKVGLPQTDLITAMWAAFGIVNAIYQRELTGEGEYIDIGMLDAVLPWLTKQAGKVFAGEAPRRMGTKDPVLAPYQSYETSDGHLNVAAANDRLFTEFCEAIGRPALSTDDRFATNADRVENMAELQAEIEATLAERTTSQWEDVLHSAGVPAGAVQSVEDALYNEQTAARDAVKTIEERDITFPVIEHPINYSHASSGFESAPPELGEDTIDVLSSLGYSEPELEALAERGAFDE